MKKEKKLYSFSQCVYSAVKTISKGQTRTYKQIATICKKPRAYRAVGNILAKSQGLPCHRVIRSDGKVGGYFGKISRENEKRNKLKQEGVIFYKK